MTYRGHSEERIFAPRVGFRMPGVPYVSIHSITIPHCVTTVYKVPHLVGYTSSVEESLRTYRKNMWGRCEHTEEIGEKEH